MTKARKLGAALLALVLVLSMGLGASAATEPGVDYSKDGQSTIHIHKLELDVSKVPQAGESGTGREIDADEAILQDGTKLSQMKGLNGAKFTIEKMDDTEEAIVVDGKVTNFTPDKTQWYTAFPTTPGDNKFNYDGEGVYSGETAATTDTSINPADGYLKFGDLPFGIYRIVETPPENKQGLDNIFYVQVPTYNPVNSGDPKDDWLTDIHVYPKNFEGETVYKDFATGTSDNVGNVYKYTIKVSPLAKAKEEDGMIVITDKMDKRLRVRLNNSGVPEADQVTVTYKDTQGNTSAAPLVNGTDYTLSWDASGDTKNLLTVTFTAAGVTKVNAGAFPGTGDNPAELLVEITAYGAADQVYKAGSITDDPKGYDLPGFEGQIWNDVEYVRDDEIKVVPGKGGGPDDGGDPEVLPKTKAGGILIDKHASGPNKDTKLAGAYFKVYTSEADAQAGINALVNPDPRNTDEEKFGPTAADGSLSINNLRIPQDQDEQDYWLVETDAPLVGTTQYNLLPDPVKVTVKAYANTAIESVSIANNTGFTLPMTGGSGTAIFTAVGLGLITIAGVTLILYRRRGKQEDNT